MKTLREYAVRYPDGHVEALYRALDDKRTPRLPAPAADLGGVLVERTVVRSEWTEVAR